MICVVLKIHLYQTTGTQLTENLKIHLSHYPIDILEHQVLSQRVEVVLNLVKGIKRNDFKGERRNNDVEEAMKQYMCLFAVTVVGQAQLLPQVMYQIM